MDSTVRLERAGVRKVRCRSQVLREQAGRHFKEKDRSRAAKCALGGSENREVCQFNRCGHPHYAIRLVRGCYERIYGGACIVSRNWSQESSPNIPGFSSAASRICSETGSHSFGIEDGSTGCDPFQGQNWPSSCKTVLQKSVEKLMIFYFSVF